MDVVKPLRRLGNSLRRMRKMGAGETARRIAFGRPDKGGGISRLLIYLILIIVGFVYVYPLLYMLSTSMKSLSDLINDGVVWLPTSLYLDNYKQALEVMKFKDTIVDTCLLSMIPALLQVLCACLTGYAIARYRFPGRLLFLGLILLTFILPKQATLLPTYLLYKDYDIIGTLGVFAYPAALGQGLNAAIIILVFFQFFSQTPRSMIEAAQLDGCGHFGVFFRICLPAVAAAFLIGFLFSLVWYWNETYLTGLFITDSGLGNKQSMSTLLMELRRFEASYKLLYPETGTVNRINEAIRMAGTMICITPLMLVYFVLQRFFVQSVDMVGIKE